MSSVSASSITASAPLRLIAGEIANVGLNVRRRTQQQQEMMTTSEFIVVVVAESRSSCAKTVKDGINVAILTMVFYEFG